MFKIGVDIGGSHITTALVNSATGAITEASYHRQKLNPHAPAEEILKIWSNTIADSLASAPEKVAHIGLAMPGPFDYSNGISLMTKQVAKYENLYGLNIRNELARRLDLIPKNIRFRNDAEAFIEGEMAYGAGKGFARGIALTLGTGLGTAIHDNGKSKDMGLGITHPLHDKVAEEFISTRWFVSRYQEITQTPILGVKELVERYAQDPIAQKVFAEFAQNISQFVEEFVAIFKPEVIIIGGNIAQGSDHFFSEIQKRIGTIPLRKSALNERAALIGSTVF